MCGAVSSLVPSATVSSTDISNKSIFKPETSYYIVNSQHFMCEVIIYSYGGEVVSKRAPDDLEKVIPHP